MFSFQTIYFTEYPPAYMSIHRYKQQLGSRLLLAIEVSPYLQSRQCLQNNIITVYT